MSPLMDTHHPLSHQLDTLLNDSEGVQQFHKFLSSTFSSGHLLDFWFACKGFRSIVDGDDQLKLLQVAKAIYRTYIKSDASLSVPVNDSTKREIRSTLTAFSQSYHNSINGEKRFPVLRSLFDAAQADIQNLLARSYFLEFLQSDDYRMIHQSLSALECNSSLSGKASHHGFADLSDNFKRGNYSSSNPQKCRTQSGSGEGVSQPKSDPTDQNSSGCIMDQCDISGLPSSIHAAKASTCGTISSDKSRQTTVETGISGPRELVTASELIAYMNPSDRSAANNNPNATSTVATNPGNEHLNGSKPPPQIGSNGVPNNDATTNTTISTTRKPGTNLAEIDPSAFAQTLSHRLEKVKESRGKMERLLSKMQPIDPEEAGGEDAELASIHAEVAKPPTPPLPVRSTRLSSSSRRATSAASGDLLRKKLSAILPPAASGVPVPIVPDDAQVILEDHCSRIWTDERRGQPLNVCRKGGSGRRSDVYSISSFDSGVGTCGAGGLNSSDSESCVSRAAAFHHHHHHQSYQRWNYAPPQQPTCSFCRRTPSMSSTPAAHRKDVITNGNYRWGVQYTRMQQQYHHTSSHHYNLDENGRAMRSRSLTSDSPSVFDSGLSSTYDHLPPPRRSRHDDSTHKIVQSQQSQQQLIDGATPTSFGGRMTPLANCGENGSGELSHRLLSEGNEPGLTASTNLDLLNSGYLPPPPNRPERQKFASAIAANCGNISSAVTTRCTESALLKTAPSGNGGVYPLLSPPPTTVGPSFNLVVGYYLCDDPVPYRTVWTGPLISPNSPPSITLGQFKQLVAKKGVYRYFFKTASDDFGTGCVHEEVGDDNAILPLWEGKVIARVERAD